jgi:hypothetical protein
MMRKKCTQCGEVKSLKDYWSVKTRGYHSRCMECERKWLIKYRNTEIGYLKQRYHNMKRNYKTHKGRYNKRLFTFDEFLAAFKMHKNIYGMRSAWGPGPKHLDDHLPITMITPGTRRRKGKKTPRIMSNLSADRLDSDQDYTLQNLIFMRNDENKRKSNSTYEDCEIQIRLHEERFIKKESI